MSGDRVKSQGLQVVQLLEAEKAGLGHSLKLRRGLRGARGQSGQENGE